MNAQQQLLINMSHLAQQNNWTDLGIRADNLLTAKQGLLPQCPTVLIPDEAQQNPVVTSFLQWLPKGSATQTIKPVSLSNADAQASIGGVSRLALFLPSDYRIQQVDLDLIQSVVLNRPLNSYAVVIGIADEISSEWDLKDLEERIRRVFIRSVMGPSYMGRLADANCFLWSEDTSRSPLLLERCIEDEEKLNAWLTSASFPTQELIGYQLNRWLDDALEKVSMSDDIGSSDYDEAAEINDLIVTINEVRTKVSRRLNESQSDVQREIMASLRSAEQAARLRWTKEVADHQVNLSVKTATAELHKIIDDQLLEWYSKLAFNDRLDRIVSDATDPIEFADWHRINQLLADQTPVVDYPEAFEIKFAQRNDLGNGQQQPTNPLSDQSDKNTKYLRQTALTGVVIAGVYAAIGLLPGVIAGGALALGLHLSNRKDRRETINEAGLQAISRFFQERIQELSRKLPDVFDPIEDHFKHCFEELRTSLEVKLETLPERQLNGSETIQDVQKKLNDYRRQLQQL